MSLTNALNVAQSGLSATQSLSRITAGNVSNAMTPGYVRREGVLVSRGGAGGVLVGELRREVSNALDRVARQETGKMSTQQAIYEGLKNYVAYLGQPDEERSPSAKFSQFSAAITTLVNAPSSNGAQLGAVAAAEELATSIRGSSEFLAQVRTEVDMEIRYEVADLNQKLYEITRINKLTTKLEPGSIEALDNQDKIDKLLDDISQITDIRVTRSSDGWISLYTTTGAALLEGDRVFDVTYNPANGTFFAGGQEITPNKAGLHGLVNGSLAGFAKLRNDILPRFQLQLDEYARTLIQSFENLDQSLGPNDAGLFTDNGKRFDPARLHGLAGRLQINELVRPSGAGEVWRLRDGLAAANSGDQSDTTQIQAMIDAFNTVVPVDQQAGLGGNLTLGRLAAEIVSVQQSQYAKAQTSLSSAKSAAEVVQASRRSIEGVNIDDEMQRLSLIEKSFSANSKLLTVIMNMYDTLLKAV